MENGDGTDRSNPIFHPSKQKRGKEHDQSVWIELDHKMPEGKENGGENNTHSDGPTPNRDSWTPSILEAGLNEASIENFLWNTDQQNVHQEDTQKG